MCRRGDRRLTVGMQRDERKPTLVLGGTGKTGRRVAEGLADRGLPVRIGSRTADPAFDWTEPGTWAPVLRDVGSVYLSYYPDLAVPGAAAAVGEFARLAARGGVRRLVLLSGRGEEGARLAERAAQAAGIEWTILRASWFDQNFDEGHLSAAVRAGIVALPTETVAEPFVDAEDIADVAVAALTDPRHAGREYEVTGPRLLTFAEAVAEIAAATGREIRFESVSPAAYSAMLTEHGVPAEVVALLGTLFTEVLDGRNASVGDGVRRALGREPRDFADFARKAAATGVWRAGNPGA